LQNIYFDLPIDVKIPKAKLQLCKNDLNRTVIGNIKEAFNINYTYSLGNIFKLTFCVPFEVNYRNKNTKNKNENELRERRIIKFIRGNEVKYCIIYRISKVFDGGQQYKQIECYGLEYELNDKIVNNLSLVSKNATQQLNAVLSLTNWTIGYVDSQFDIKYRGLDIASSTVLEAVKQIAQTFNALIVYDSVNRTVSFYDFENYGQYKGGIIKKGKILKNITYETDTAEYCTRLEVYGKNDISINSVNPTGTNYIEDYSSILRGFKRNPDKSVISSAPDISDSLANALLDYQELVESKRGEFQNLLDQLNEKTEDLIVAEGQLVDLQSELTVIEDNISTANATGGNPAPYIAQKNAKLQEISNKQSQINSLKNQIQTIRNSINQLKDLLDVNNNFTQDQLKEWNQHIVVKVYRNEYIDDPQQLLEAAKMEMEKMREPKIVVDIGIVNLFKVITEYKNWDKMNLGDIIKIEIEDMGIKINAKIIEMDFNEDNADIKLTISNVREILSDEERVIRDLYKTVSTSTTFEINKYKYLDAASKANEVYQTINNIWDATKREIIASNNETVEISRKGIRTYDINDPMKVSIMQHGVIAVSNDGGNTWKNAITWRGIVAERLYGVITATNDLTIQNEAGTVTINANGFNVTDMNLSLVTSNNRSRININPTNGIQIQKNTGTASNPVWTNQIYLDTDGNSVFGGFITIGSGNNIIKADQNGFYIGNANFSSAPFRVTYSGQVTATSLNMTGGTIKIGNNFSVDEAGIATMTGANISGNITMLGGSINWSSVGKPIYNAWEVGAIPNTYIDANGVWTGYLNADRIIAGSISAERITGGHFTALTSINIGRPTDYTVKKLSFNEGAAILCENDYLNAWARLHVSCVDFKVSASRIYLGSSPTSVRNTVYLDYSEVRFNNSILDFTGATTVGLYARFS